MATPRLKNAGGSLTGRKTFTFKERSSAMFKAMRNRARDALKKAGDLMLDHIQQQMQNSRGGRTYFIPSRPPVPHTASAPWAYPAVWSGEFIKSIRENSPRIRQFPNVVQVVIGTNSPLGLMLEFGTSKMDPRPWLSRAEYELGPQVQADIKNEFADQKF